jgi:hypothetical protein
MWWYIGAGSIEDLGWAVLLLPLVLLDLVLKGLALWRSARRGEKWWFVALLIVNSVGILPGIYLLTHREGKKK